MVSKLLFFPASLMALGFSVLQIWPLWAKEGPLRKIDEAETSIVDSQLFDDAALADRASLLKAIDHSLSYLRTKTAAQKYPVAGISREKMEKSLLRFRYLLTASPTATALQESILLEFDLYQSVGADQQGKVLVTGYYEPVFSASRLRTNVFRFPLYRLPSDFTQWKKPHPTRRELETTGRLKGKELVWLKDPMEAFLVHIQGSAKLKLSATETMTVGFAGKTDRPYVSIGSELVKDGKLSAEAVTLPAILSYFKQHPQQLLSYLHRNPSYVFFRETQGKPATGSIGVPVTANRSIATDKSLMPPGGLALIQTSLPFAPSPTKPQEFRSVSRFVLDQDTGSAIQGAGRVDFFLGSGPQAEARAGILKSEGRLYYLVLKDPPPP